MLTSYVNEGDIPSGATAPELFILRNKERDVRFVGADGLEPLSGTITKWITGDGTTTSFTVGTMPANVIVDLVNIAVSGTAGTAATTIAIGKSGTTGAYAAASNYSTSMNAAGAKAVTTVKAYETAAVTVLATFSAAWDSGAKVCVTVHYTKIEPAP